MANRREFGAAAILITHRARVANFELKAYHGCTKKQHYGDCESSAWVVSWPSLQLQLVLVNVGLPVGWRKVPSD